MPWDARIKMPHEIVGDSFRIMPMGRQMPPLPASQQLIQTTGEDGADSVFQKPDLKFAKATDHRRETLERETDMGTEMRLQEVDKKWSCLILEQISAWEIGRLVATSGTTFVCQGWPSGAA